MTLNTSDPQVVEAMRQAIRDAIFTSKPKSKVLTVFGTEIELRQPGLRTIMTAQASEDDMATKTAKILIAYAFVPGTVTRVFEDVDVDGILGLPWGEDMTRIQEAISELTNVNEEIKTTMGNSVATQ